ncbi:hypothetical protein QJS10_CPA06g00444 [Acorus calamus]|uniref:Uncharacterized protein n=1 Tax=Acorus calamus TaxID=4465 RepID=A0AAV9ELJ2_ACOCL|nr:hypothetical protein QJS10_CPA06g00444 [Acorus calamus]
MKPLEPAMPLWWFENINSEEINKVINVNTNTVLMISMSRCFAAEEVPGTVLTPKALKHVLEISNDDIIRSKGRIRSWQDVHNKRRQYWNNHQQKFNLNMKGRPGAALVKVHIKFNFSEFYSPLARGTLQK